MLAGPCRKHIEGNGFRYCCQFGRQRVRCGGQTHFPSLAFLTIYQPVTLCHERKGRMSRGMWVSHYSKGEINETFNSTGGGGGGHPGSRGVLVGSEPEPGPGPERGQGEKGGGKTLAHHQRHRHGPGQAGFGPRVLYRGNVW